MSSGKVGTLALYVVLALIAVTQAGTAMATLAVWILLAIAVTHVVEMVILFRLCKESTGSLAGNLFNVFLFGYFHMQDMKASARKSK